MECESVSWLPKQNHLTLFLSENKNFRRIRRELRAAGCAAGIALSPCFLPLGQVVHARLADAELVVRLAEVRAHHIGVVLFGAIPILAQTF
jgi:hypothetical protein